VVKVAAEKNSTLVLPFPVELLRFLEHANPAETPDTTIPATTAPVPPSGPLAATSTGLESAAAASAWENDPLGSGRAHPAAPRVATVAQGADNDDPRRNTSPRRGRDRRHRAGRDAMEAAARARSTRTHTTPRTGASRVPIGPPRTRSGRQPP
jgi:hypothetical protein